MAASPSSKPKPQHTPAYRRLVRMLLHMRKQAKLSQRALAAKIHLPPSTVHKIEHGDRRIDPTEFIKWCRACGVEPAKVIKEMS